MAKKCTCKVVALLNKPISFFGVLVAVAVVVVKLPEQSNLPKATTQNAKAYENRTRVGLYENRSGKGIFGTEFIT